MKNNFDSEAIATMLESILSNMLDYPFVVDAFPGSGNKFIFKVIHDSRDCGAIIGKKGINVKALRRIMMAISGKHDIGLELQLAEKYGETR